MTKPNTNSTLESVLSREELLANFMGYLTSEDVAKNTLKAYRHDIEAFLRYLVDHEFESPTYQGAQDFREHLIGKGMSDNTINRYLASMKRFLEWGVETQAFDTQGKLKSIQQTTTPGRALTRREGLSLINVVNREGSFRDQTLVFLGLGVGLRISEVVSLMTNNVEFTPNRVIVGVRGATSKGRVSREVRAGGEKTRQAIVGRIRELEDQAGGKLEKPVPLIGIGRTAAWKVIQKYASLAGVKDVSPHALRRTFGQMRRAGGAPIETVQRELGHAKVDTTVIYTMPADDTWDTLRQDDL